MACSMECSAVVLQTVITMPDRVLAKATCSRASISFPSFTARGRYLATFSMAGQGVHVAEEAVLVGDVALGGMEEGVKALVGP